MEKIIEGNKLIALFMGAYIAKPDQSALDMDDKFPNGKDRLTPDKMEYHSSWQWIMPVVEEIEKKTGKRLQIMGNFCYAPGVFVAKGEELRVYRSTKIEAVYLAVVQFIQWYNSNQPER